MSYNVIKYWQMRDNPNNKNGMAAERVRFDAEFIRQNTMGSAPILELGPGTGRTFSAYEAGRNICTLDVTDNYSSALQAQASKYDIGLSENFISDLEAPFPFEDDQFEFGVIFQVFIHQQPELFAHSFSEMARTCSKLVFLAGIHANSPLSAEPAGAHVFAHDYLAAVERCRLRFSNLTLRDSHLYGVTERMPNGT